MASRAPSSGVSCAHFYGQVGDGALPITERQALQPKVGDIAVSGDFFDAGDRIAPCPALPKTGVASQLILGFAVKDNDSVALCRLRQDSPPDRHVEWRDYGLSFQVINDRQEDFADCAWLPSQTDMTRASYTLLQLPDTESLR
ncbi:hypothetical protein [Pseudomonas retamae]|uniref:Uncharacterized protein n=1 Tax=Pseudomonas retamae TaxID=702110 RepID=A0ABW7D9X3_9PSED